MLAFRCTKQSWLHVSLTRFARGLSRSTQFTRKGPQQAQQPHEQAVDDGLLPKIAIVGRPNVGKSALFNRLVRRRLAMVYDTPNSHVTRDYQEARGQLGDLHFRVSDTSGLEPREGTQGGGGGGGGWGGGPAALQVRATALTARLLQQSHLALFVVDAKQGVLPADEELAAWLAAHVPRERVVLVANKAEGRAAQEAMPQTVYDCYRLGFGEPVALSATTGEGLGDLFVALQPHVDGAAQRLREAAGMAPAEGPAAHLSGGAAGGAEGGGRRRDRMVERRGVGAEASVVEGVEGEEEEDGEEGAEGPRTDVLKLAIMGLPNAGKSTLLNALLGEERALTGPEPGLTRDAVRAAWAWGEQAVELVDTAGWIGAGRTEGHDDVGGDIADMSRSASLRALAGVHVVVLVVDSQRALKSGKVLSRREVHLAGSVLREGKALLVAANKMDALNKQERTTYMKALRRELSERFVDAGQLPVVPLSAAEGRGVGQLMPEVVQLYRAWNTRLSTARLNRFVERLALRCVGSGGTEAALQRIKYMVQVKARPPTLVSFLSGSRPPERAFASFLAAQVREVLLGCGGVPLRIYFRNKERHAERAKRPLRTQLPGAAAQAGADGDGDEEEEDEDEGGAGGRDSSIMEEAMRHVRAMEELEEEEGQQEERRGRAGRGMGASSGGSGRVRQAGSSSEEEEDGRWDAPPVRGVRGVAGSGRGAGDGGGAGRKRGRDEQHDSEEEDSYSEGELMHAGGDFRHASKQRGQEEQGRAEDVSVARTGGKRAESGAGRPAADAAPAAAAAAQSRMARGVPALGSRASARVQVLHDEDEEEQGGMEAVAGARGAGVPDSRWGGREGGVGQRGGGGPESQRGSLQEGAEGGSGRGISRGARLREADEEEQLSTGALLSARAAASEGGRGAAGTEQAVAGGKRGRVWDEEERHGAGQKRSGLGAGLPKRALAYRAMLLSRKPSAPLVPIAAPRRRAAKTRAQDRSRGQGE